MLEKEIRELEGGLLSFPHEDTQPLPGGRRISAVWKKQLLRLLFLLLYPLAFLLRDLAAANPDWAEQAFAQGFYPGFSSAVGSVFGWMPFSFSEFLVYALLILLGVWIIRTIISAVKKKLRLVNLVRTLITFALIGGVGMNLFYVMWGFNYSRYSVAYTLNLNVEEQPPQALADLCVLLAKQANALRAQQAEDEHGTFFYEEGNSGILKKIPGAYAALAQDYPQFARSIAIPAPKPVLASEMMSYAGISGIYIPFTEEANVNVHQPPLLVAFAGAHESAHFLGVCREDEANFISYLACLYSDDPAVQYSGTILALIHAGNALYEISPDAYYELYSHYSEGVQRDLAAHNGYWDAYEGEVQDTVSEINDAYLRGQNQADGIKSYGRMVDLLLAYYSEPN